MSSNTCISIHVAVFRVCRITQPLEWFSDNLAKMFTTLRQCAEHLGSRSQHAGHRSCSSISCRLFNSSVTGGILNNLSQMFTTLRWCAECISHWPRVKVAPWAQKSHSHHIAWRNIWWGRGWETCFRQYKQLSRDLFRDQARGRNRWRRMVPQLFSP